MPVVWPPLPRMQFQNMTAVGPLNQLFGPGDEFINWLPALSLPATQPYRTRRFQ